MIPKICLGSMLLKNIELGEGDFKKCVKDFLDLGILLASLFPIVQKCLFMVSAIELVSVIFVPSDNSCNVWD